MVKLRERAIHFNEFVVVVLVALGSTGLVSKLAVAAALEARGVEGVDMAETIGPGHLKTVDTDEGLVGNFFGSLVTQYPLAADTALKKICAQVNTLISLVVEGV